MTGLAAEAPDNKTISIVATYLEAHRIASSLRAEKGRGRPTGRTEVRMNTKLHAVTDATGRPICFLMSAGEVSGDTGARALVSSVPAADWLLGDRGCDAGPFRKALANRGMTPCIPRRKSRGNPSNTPHVTLPRNAGRAADKRRYRKRNRIEVMFGRLKDWRRMVTRYDRSPAVFLSAIALAATVIFR